MKILIEGRKDGHRVVFGRGTVVVRMTCLSEGEEIRFHGTSPFRKPGADRGILLTDNEIM